jgi:hypothetical protein
MDEDVIFAFIPIVAIGGFFAWMIAISPVGKAWADRIRHGRTPPDGTVRGREEIRAVLDELQREVAELAERVDFTERLLARQREAARLPPPL